MPYERAYAESKRHADEFTHECSNGDIYHRDSNGCPDRCPDVVANRVAVGRPNDASAN